MAPCGSKSTFEITGGLFFHLAEDFHNAKSGVLGKQQGFTDAIQPGQDFFFHFFEKGVCPFPNPILLQRLQALLCWNSSWAISSASSWNFLVMAAVVRS
jgi:hypothetical protein